MAVLLWVKDVRAVISEKVNLWIGSDIHLLAKFRVLVTIEFCERDIRVEAIAAGDFIVRFAQRVARFAGRHEEIDAHVSAFRIDIVCEIIFRQSYYLGQR